jgi:nucleoside-diphosphate-sugar epimerase
VRGDVLLPETLDAVMEGVKAVYHLAGMLGGMPVAKREYWDLHVEGTRNVLTAADRAGVGRFVHVSSPGVLGPIADPPAGEDRPHAPSNVYERTKSEGEKLALTYAAQVGLSLVVARPEFVYGPGDTHVLGLYRTIQRGLFFYIGSGENLVHPTYVDDAIQGIILCGQHGAAGGVYHIAGERPVSLQELATTIARELGVGPPRVHVPKALAIAGASALGPVARVLGAQLPLSREGVRFFSETRAFSTARAEAELGYRAQVSLEEGVHHTVAWYRAHALL